jgi:hypothetical protein
MARSDVLTREPIGNSVYYELTRNYRITFRAAKRVLGERHMLTTACLHASLFPSDRMSGRMVWDQFEALSLTDRTDLLQVLRN